MFETSVVQARVKAVARRPLLFSMSIGAHAAALVGVVTMSIAGVTLPTSAPNQLRIPVIASLPPMLGDGGTPKRAPAATPPAQQPKRQTAPPAVTAPNVVPSAVPQVASAQTSTATDIGPATGSGGSDTGPAGTPGVPWGSPQGVLPDGPPATAEAPAAKIYQVVGDVKAPVVLKRVAPTYPEMARRARLNGFVILECIIDQNGRIRDARVLRSSSLAFEQPALDAIQKWEFSPGSLDGKPVNVQFDLTVNFRVN
jgi:protein TonB